MATRNLLHRSKLARFTDWLTSQGWTIQGAKGYYEVLRATKPGHDTLIVWTKIDAKEHLSVPDKWAPMVRKFIITEKTGQFKGEG